MNMVGEYDLPESGMIEYVSWVIWEGVAAIYWKEMSSEWLYW